MDITFVNKIPFIVSIIKGLKVTTIEYLSNKSEISLVKSINKIVGYYKSHSFHVRTMFVDTEVQFLEEKLFSAALNTTGARYHVPEVEIQIQVIKERMQAHHSKLPFPNFTMRMTLELAKHVVMFLNDFPPKSGLLTTYIPRTIVTGKSLD